MYVLFFGVLMRRCCFFGYAHLIVCPDPSVYSLLSAVDKKVSCCTISVPPLSALVNAPQSGSWCVLLLYVSMLLSAFHDSVEL